jgi:hypothetical protein
MLPPRALFLLIGCHIGAPAINQVEYRSIQKKNQLA